MSRFQPSNHSSKFEITGKTSDLLKDKRILIGMTGSVAVVEIVNLSRLLMRNGAEVFIGMTKAATELIHPNLLEWTTGNPVITELTGQIEHVHLCGEHPDKVDLLLIAPSTANTIGKIASGIDDTVVTTMATTALGTRIPIAIVPAMHATMYENPIVNENIKKLKKIGIIFIGPRVEEGKAKIATNKEILEEILSLFSKKNFDGKKIVVTAGPTRVWIDDIRFISNPSTGKMGIEIALEAASQGGDVTLILGPTSLEVNNPKINVLEIETPNDIISEIDKIKKIDLFISAAAISDYKPEKTTGKIRSGKDKLIINLEPTPKIIDYVKKKFPKSKIVGFKAETGISERELVKKVQESLKQHGIEMVVGNIVNKEDQGFRSTKNAVTIVKKSGESKSISLTTKRKIAQVILEELQEKK